MEAAHELERAPVAPRRFGEAERSLDVLGWYFERKMLDEARIRGTFYEGDLDLLRGAGVPLPFSGDDKREAGGNLEARIWGLRLFAQYVDQEIASLPRHGFEVVLEHVAVPDDTEADALPAGRSAPVAAPAPAARHAFRTGLRDSDLGLTPEERREFE